MYKIIFEPQVIQALQRYSDGYLNYYDDLYKDSGIWSREAIIDGYVKEANNRFMEIVDTIEQKLKNPHISYPNKKVVIKWRSKILLVSFTEEKVTRTITLLEIR